MRAQPEIILGFLAPPSSALPKKGSMRLAKRKIRHRIEQIEYKVTLKAREPGFTLNGVLKYTV